ncbi:endonuclease/exonuclease/phosphatase family protein [Risungbinella massiliensis]|uniref:endonuclease/exonuclease/phosphatase family protein n=1 Tax=Risungbinella massiliensis TaxID=1329796 RepID=UPI0005CB933B|nr:endonuclease/exonuclease/phosphatase family protein [Risungbinella massiliensis]
MKLNVMTFNIHHGRGTDRKLSLERIAQVIKESNANLIGLNEVDRSFSKRSNFADQISWLAKQLQMEYAFGGAITLKSKNANTPRQYGNAFLSQFPILFQKNHLLPYQSRFSESRSLLEIHILVQQVVLKAYVTHFSLNPLIHRKQTDFLLQQVMNDLHPTIIMGDWNKRPHSKSWHNMMEHFVDVCHAVGKGPYYTFPSTKPKVQLDYIFVSRDLKVKSVEVEQKLPVASDHLPLKAGLVLT